MKAENQAGGLPCSLEADPLLDFASSQHFTDSTIAHPLECASIA